MEHWLPLFHERLETVDSTTCADAVVTADHQIGEAFAARHELITDYYDARLKTGAKGGMSGAADYKPVPPERLYLKPSEWERLLEGRSTVQFTSFDAPADTAGTIDLGGRRHEGFARARTAQGVNLFDVVAEHVKQANAAGRRVLVAGYTEGSASRLQHLLQEHGATTPVPVSDFATVQGLPAGALGIAVWPVEHGFVLDGLEVIGEEDILGDRLSRPARKRRPAERFIAEASALSEGDLVVHREHGVGRYEGLVTLEIHFARHDCLRLTYDGGDKLFVPVENIDVLSRYGAGEEGATLDRLGGVAWQSRKARLKQRIADMADRLIKIAAERAVQRGDTMSPPEGAYEEFCARFPYAETEDQLQAISDVIDDLSSGKPMDRLICGDVGFGKTEVALRAAFVAALSGKQVAVIGPTTLLARQHHRTFVERFAGFPVRIGRLSRLVVAKEAKATKEAMKEGTLDIVVGTHALLGKGVEFKDLGLLIVDEEQHFGVAHKERLKELRADVHVLTLSATPIPRTLQLAHDGRAGHEPDRHAAGRPAGGAHLRDAVRRGHRFARPCCASITAAARASMSARASPTWPRSPPRCASWCPRSARPWWRMARWRRPRARGRDERDFVRRQVRRAAGDQHRRKRPRHPAMPTRWSSTAPTCSAWRSSTSCAAGSVAVQDPGLCLPDRAAGAGARPRRRPTRLEGDADPRYAGRRLPALPATTSTSAAPATCWARSSRAISARSASSSTSSSWRRRSTPPEAAPARPPRPTGRPSSISASRCCSRRSTCRTSRCAWGSTGASGRWPTRPRSRPSRPRWSTGSARCRPRPSSC